jgi:hypothetical protein
MSLNRERRAPDALDPLLPRHRDTGKRVSGQTQSPSGLHPLFLNYASWTTSCGEQVKARQARCAASRRWAIRTTSIGHDVRDISSPVSRSAPSAAAGTWYWRDRLACFCARSRATCTNRLIIRRQEVKERVLVALREKLMRRDLFEDFCREYVRELNRLRCEWSIARLRHLLGQPPGDYGRRMVCEHRVISSRRCVPGRASQASA